MAAKTLSKEERLVQEQMLAILEWASEYPKPNAWHKIGNMPATKKAAELLAASLRSGRKRMGTGSSQKSSRERQ
jgi:hypothetical protein